MEFSICIDVDDVDRAVEFYGRGVGLTVVEQHPDWAQVKLGDQTFWIMKAPGGVQGSISRDYRRHWTPVHLDFAVDDIDAAIAKLKAGGVKFDLDKLETPVCWMAQFRDPDGNKLVVHKRKKQ